MGDGGGWLKLGTWCRFHVILQQTRWRIRCGMVTSRVQMAVSTTHMILGVAKIVLIFFLLATMKILKSHGSPSSNMEAWFRWVTGMIPGSPMEMEIAIIEVLVWALCNKLVSGCPFYWVSSQNKYWILHGGNYISFPICVCLFAMLWLWVFLMFWTTVNTDSMNMISYLKLADSKVNLHLSISYWGPEGVTQRGWYFWIFLVKRVKCDPLWNKPMSHLYDIPIYLYNELQGGLTSYWRPTLKHVPCISNLCVTWYIWIYFHLLFLIGHDKHGLNIIETSLYCFNTCWGLSTFIMYYVQS